MTSSEKCLEMGEMTADGGVRVVLGFLEGGIKPNNLKKLNYPN
jgi:hypothetical protein